MTNPKEEKPELCKGCKKHYAEQGGWPGYCGWCDKKIDDAMGEIVEYNRQKGRI